MLPSDHYSIFSWDQAKGGRWVWLGPQYGRSQGHPCRVTFPHHPKPTHWEVLLALP